MICQRLPMQEQFHIRPRPQGLGIVRPALLNRSSDNCETMERMHQSISRIFLFWRADIYNTQFRKNETSYQRTKNEKYRRRIFTEDRGRY